MTGWFHLGALLLSFLFSYLVLRMLGYSRKTHKWAPILAYIIILGAAIYGLAFFVQATVNALPKIAEKALPAVTEWADQHRIRLPFTDLGGLKDEAIKSVTAGAKSLGALADFARGATAQFIYILVGAIVAMGVFVNPNLALEPPARGKRENLYTACCEEIGKSCATFYDGFCIIMRAQVLIAAIDATLTGLFTSALGFSYVLVAVGATFICGLVPMIGNLLSNTLVVGLGFMASPTKGLAALAFLVCVHQLEYVLNSKIVGGKIHTPFWLTLLGLVIGDSLMGVTGIIIAPVVLHYIRVEASNMPVKPKAD